MKAQFYMTIVIGHRAEKAMVECDADALLAAEGVMSVESAMLAVTDELRRALAVKWEEGRWKRLGNDNYHS